MSIRRLFTSLFTAKNKTKSEGSWRGEYEYHANLEKQKLYTKPVTELLADVEGGRFDTYHLIWYAIAERAEPKQALPVLFKAINNCQEYLHQYHCAAALLHLLEIEPLINGYPSNSTAVDYTTARANYLEARRNLQSQIEAILNKEA